MYCCTCELTEPPPAVPCCFYVDVDVSTRLRLFHCVEPNPPRDRFGACSPLPESAGPPSVPGTGTNKARRDSDTRGAPPGGRGGRGGRRGGGYGGGVDGGLEEEGMGRRDPDLPQFPDASPATCVQAFVDDAFGYHRPGGEVGSPLPLPVQVSVCFFLLVSARVCL